MKVFYNKLVRDRIPEIIQANGRLPVTRVLEDHFYQSALRDKLAEETQEACQAPPGKLAAELADVLEVLHAIAEANGLTWDHILATAASKRAERGAFDSRIFLEWVEEAG